MRRNATHLLVEGLGPNSDRGDLVVEHDVVGQLPQLRLHRAEPEAGVALAGGDDHQEVIELFKEVLGGEQVSPGLVALLDDGVEGEDGLLALLRDEAAVLSAHVEGGVHLRLAGGDDGHAVLRVPGVDHRVPS